jgi:hypothetical protein
MGVGGQIDLVVSALAHPVQQPGNLGVQQRFTIFMQRNPARPVCIDFIHESVKKLWSNKPPLCGMRFVIAALGRTMNTAKVTDTGSFYANQSGKPHVKRSATGQAVQQCLFEHRYRRWSLCVFVHAQLSIHGLTHTILQRG